MTLTQQITEAKQTLAGLERKAREERIGELKVKLAQAKATARTARDAYPKLETAFLKKNSEFDNLYARCLRISERLGELGRAMRDDLLADMDALNAEVQEQQRTLASVQGELAIAKRERESLRDAAIRAQNTYAATMNLVRQLDNQIKKLTEEDAPRVPLFPGVFQKV